MNPVLSDPRYRHCWFYFCIGVTNQFYSLGFSPYSCMNISWPYYINFKMVSMRAQPAGGQGSRPSFCLDPHTFPVKPSIPKLPRLAQRFIMAVSPPLYGHRIGSERDNNAGRNHVYITSKKTQENVRTDFLSWRQRIGIMKWRIKGPYFCHPGPLSL